jgi:hypothetical protein
MASDDVITGRIFTLGSGTLGLVTRTPVTIDKIRITWSGASNGLVVLDTVSDEDGTADKPILRATTIGAASATNGWSTLTQEFDMGGIIVHGITKTAMTGVNGNTGVHIQTK